MFSGDSYCQKATSFPGKLDYCTKLTYSVKKPFNLVREVEEKVGTVLRKESRSDKLLQDTKILDEGGGEVFKGFNLQTHLITKMQVCNQ